jgi:site-specific recombinase XerD
MIDWNGRMLNLPTSKNGEALHIPMNAAALAALKVVYQQSDRAGCVFASSKTGEALQNSRHWFEKAVGKAGIANFHWHDLRHHFASKLRQAGAKLEDIAELLCHKGLTMTKRYSHLGPNQLHDVAALLDSVSTTVAREAKPETNLAVRYLN